MTDGVVFNHVGHCVADLDRARRFYVDLLGFAVDREVRPPDDVTAKLLGLTPPLDLTALYLVRDGLVLELLHFGAPGQARPVRRRTVNEPGLTHLSLSLADVPGVLARIGAFGGEVLTETDVGAGVFVRDPDGQLVELLPMEYRAHLDAHGYR